METVETTNVEQLYEERVKPLSAIARLRLLAIIAGDLAGAPLPVPRRSIMELRGLGAELWEGIDPQEYVNELRREWDHRP